MTKYKSIIIIAVLIIINTIFYLKYNSLLNKYDILKEGFSKTEFKIKYFNSVYNVLKKNKYEEIINSNIVLDKNLSLMDENNNNKFLFELFNNKGKLVIIKYSDKGCGECIEIELKTIMKHVDVIGKDNIILVTDKGTTGREIKSFKLNNKIDFDIYTTDSINFDFNGEKKVAVIVLGNDFMVNHFFIPEKSLPHLSDNNYNAICAKYFN